MCGSGFGRGHWKWGWAHGSDAEREQALSDKGYLAILLDLLKEEPKTGYALVQGLEERLKDLFEVGPARVYPALQLLEDLGYITAEIRDDKKHYAITEAGRAYIAEREEALKSFWARAAAGKYRLEVRDLAWELKSLAWSFVSEAGDRRFEADRLKRIREVIANARKTIEEDLAG